jgi:DNA-binding transcriptional ArsR family regulator
MLTYLFKTPERIKILETVLKKEKITVSQITQETGVSKGMVSRYLKTMKEENFLHREKQTYSIINHARTRALKTLIGLQQLKWDEISPLWAESAGLYGSWASGTNTELSDVDIWIKVVSYPSEDEMNQLYKNIKNNTYTEVNILILTPEKLEQIKKADPPFYHSLQIWSLILEGEPF